jgi:hypothetical protein
MSAVSCSESKHLLSLYAGLLLWTSMVGGSAVGAGNNSGNFMGLITCRVVRILFFNFISVKMVDRPGVFDS